MDWQQLTSILIVIAAAILLARREFRRRRNAKLHGCNMDCGCTSAPKSGDVRKTLLNKP